MAEILRTATRLTLLIVAFAALGWAVFPAARPVLASVMLGMAVGLVNSLLLHNRVRLIGSSAAAGKRRAGFGLASRLAMVLLAVMTAYRFPHLFHLPTALGSCFVLPLAAPLIGIWHLKRKR